MTERNGAEVFCFDTLDSTSSEVRRLVASGKTARLLVVAEEQTAGRGRRGRSFYSPKGTGLYLSVFVPRVNGEGVSPTCRAAVAVARAIEAVTGRRTGIKWVNDLELDGKKVAGILAERVGDGVIFGVGINLTTRVFPDDVASRAGNIGAADKTALCAAVADALFEAAEKDGASYLEEYRQRSVLTGRTIRYEQNGVILTGTVRGIDETGGLTVERDGVTVTLTSGEITVRAEE